MESGHLFPVGRSHAVGLGHVRWAAPGSLNLEPIEDAWGRRTRLADLGSVSGPWAVALGSSASEIVLVADPVGVQPLYWARTAHGQVVASSWLAQLVDLPDVDERLDYEGVLLDQGWECRGPSVLDRTMFAAVSRIPGGHALRVRGDGSTRLERYWDPRSLPGPDESLTLTDCAELLREQLESAVRRLVPLDVPVGAHVSSGLDCTAVASIAQSALREAGGGLVGGYSWAPSEADIPPFAGDERGILGEVSEVTGIPIRTSRRSAAPDSFGEWFWALDPARYPESSHRHEVGTLPQAKADGAQVLLSGWGGDELASFNGRGVMRRLVRQGKLQTAWRETSMRADVLIAGRVPAHQRFRAFAGSLSVGLPESIGGVVRHPRSAWAGRRRSSEIDAAIHGYSPLAAGLRRGEIGTYQALRDHHEVQLHLLGYGHLQHRTDAWYQTGRLFGIDYRYPLLDLGVVEAALRLPWWAYFSQGWNRVAYRMAVESWVPPSVVWNTAKNEPALMAYSTQRAAARGSASPRLRPGDEQFAEVMRLVDLTWGSSGGSFDPTATVRARPDLAPRSPR